MISKHYVVYLPTFLFLLISLAPSMSTGVVINEVLASNGGTLTTSTGLLLDEDGASSDWIELFNPASYTIELTGWTLSDDADEPAKWVFPTGTSLAAGEYLLVFASGKNRTAPPLHTNFKLDSDGEFLGLYKPDGSIAHAYAPAYPRQLTDLTYGLAERKAHFVHAGSPARYHVPQEEDAGRDWFALDFNDAAWTPGRSMLGFSPSPIPRGVDIGRKTTAGSHTRSDEILVVNGGGRGFETQKDSFYYVYVPVHGDGELSARLLSQSSSDPEAQAGLMIRQGLENNAVYLSQGFLNAGGFRLQQRREKGKNTTVNDIATLTTPTWLRLVREGGSVSLYHSPDGRQWTLQGTTLIDLTHEVTMGLFVTANASRGRCQASFDQVSFEAAAAQVLRQEMLGINTSLQMRLPFQANEVDTLESMTLQMRYEDAFVAYLNGVEIGLDNVSGPPAWNSHADVHRPHDAGKHYKRFDVSPFLDLLREGTNILAVQAMNDHVLDTELSITSRLSAASGAGVAQYLAEATPGRVNSTATLNIVADPQFNYERGFYDGAFELTLATSTPDARIRYTTDGTPPNDLYGTSYTTPIPIDQTTCIRAIAVKPGWVASRVATHSYLFLDQVLQQPVIPPGFPARWGPGGKDYAMDPQVVNDPRYRDELKGDLLSLPTLSLVMKVEDMFGSTGLYANPFDSGIEWERPVSAEYILPDGDTGFQVDCGIRIYGGVGRREYKKTLRLLFKRQYGPTKLHYPLFGPEAVDEFDTLILRAGFNNSWHGVFNQGPQYVRDEWMRRTQLDMGHPSLHGTFVHLYINGLYWGLYNPVERCNADFGSSYLGGDKEDYDALNSYPRTIVDGNPQAWNKAQSIAEAGVADPNGYAELARYVDIPNLIDYMLLNFYAGNDDWDHKNWYAVRKREEGAGWKFVSWDAERVLESITGDNRTQTVGSYNKPSYYYQALQANPEFRLLFADHSYRHFFHDGTLTPASTYTRYKKLVDWIHPAMACESARWGDNQHLPAYSRDKEWVSERDRLLDEYFPQRTQIVLGFLRDAGMYPMLDAPEFHINGRDQHGGTVTRASVLTMEVPEGMIYFTTNGDDPRQALTGTPSANAVVYTDPITLYESVRIKARAFDEGNWSALHETTYAVGALTSSLRITEIMYNPQDPDHEFLELQNIGLQIINLSLVQFTDGIQFHFPSLELAPLEYCLVVKDRQAFENNYGTGAIIAGTYQGRLSNAGENLTLVDVTGIVIQRFRFDDDWFDLTDGMGFSLTVKDPQQTPVDAYSDKTSWRLSTQIGGSPGYSDAERILEMAQ